jgi:fucose permease
MASVPVVATSATPPTFTLRDRALVYAGFSATGVSLALPGALMPWLLAHWALQDSQAGLLLFLFFLGSSMGAVLSRGSLPWSIARGGLCTATGAALLPVVSRDGAFAAIFLYGLGLGITMTSTSLLQSRRFAEDCAAELTRLNLLWALGACTGPWLILHKGIGDATHNRHVLFGLAGFFALYAVAVAAFERNVPAAAPATPRKFSLLAVPVPLLVLVFCATGVEASSGGWLATYSQRSGHSLGITIAAPTCFWAGLLLSRLLHSSSRVSRAARRLLLTANLVTLAAALVALILFGNAPVILAAAFFVGFCAGPMYPLLLALIFEHNRGSLIFVLAGLGSSILPFLTGTLSSTAHSLRGGLLVPAAAATAMALCGWLTVRVRGNGLQKNVG